MLKIFIFILFILEYQRILELPMDVKHIFSLPNVIECRLKIYIDRLKDLP